MVYIFQTMLVYNILNLLDSLYLMLSGFTAGCCGVILSYFWMGEPFQLPKFIIIIVLLALVIGYELEGMNQAILAQLRSDLDTERKRKLLRRLVLHTDQLYLPSTRRRISQVFEG